MVQSAVLPKILYIDDTPEARVLVRRLLATDYRVLEADNGLKGIDLAQETRPDLILVDLHMPHLSGYEVATRLKSLMPQTPVIALTADVTVHVRERVLASGCDGYMSKPIDPDTFVDQVQSFLDGEREKLEDDSFREAYQQKLVARLENKVRQLTQILERNEKLNKLLEASARVGQSITSILDLDTLLSTTVDIICEEFSFYFAAIFLLDESNERAILRAGRGEPGRQLLEQKYKLGLYTHSLIGEAIRRNQAQVAADVDKNPLHLKHPLLPLTRSEVVFPLATGDQPIGALSVQSTQKSAFGQDAITALQILADQLAVAIENARLLKRLEDTHQELLRVKTYEAIATATGEAIHWVGNKAAPIPGSVARITKDVTSFLGMAHALLKEAPSDLRQHKFAQLLAQAAQEMTEQNIDLEETLALLEARPLKRLRRMLSAESIFEDLDIIQNSAQAILDIKEDLIGPARQRQIETLFLPDLLRETIASMGLSDEVVRTLFAADLPPVRADRAQLNRVFVNLIKNAMEAMEDTVDKKLFIWARLADEPDSVVVEFIDNGAGIPPDQLDKIWGAFYTTKGDRGGTGLGLPACAQIVRQLGGRITIQSDVGLGSTFSVFLPAVTE